MYDEFVDVIVEGRDLSEEHVRGIGYGRCCTGKQAVEVDLVDEIGSFEDTINELMEDYDLNDAQVIQYDLGPGYWTQFLMNAKNIFDGDSNEIKTIMTLISESDQPRAMYLYQGGKIMENEHDKSEFQPNEAFTENDVDNTEISHDNT